MNCTTAWLNINPYTRPFKIRWNGTFRSFKHLLISIPSATLCATELLLKYCWAKSGKYRNECCRRLSIQSWNLASNTLWLLIPNEFGTVIFGLGAQRWTLDKLGIQYLHSQSRSDKQFRTLQVNWSTHVQWLVQRLGHRIYRITVSLSFPVSFPLLSTP